MTVRFYAVKLSNKLSLLISIIETKDSRQWIQFYPAIKRNSSDCVRTPSGVLNTEERVKFH
jgi:hypothetical protein